MKTPKPTKSPEKPDSHQTGAITAPLETKKSKGEGKHLTAKQEKFALSLAQGMTQADAYRAGYNAENMKPETVQECASRLMADRNISARVEELRAEVGAKMAEEVTYDYQAAMRELDDAIAFAKENCASGAVVSALSLKQKISGLQVEDRKNDRGPVTGLTHDQTKAALEALMAIKKAAATA